MSFSRSERSGVAHFPIIIFMLFSSSKVLPNCIALCSFFVCETNHVLKYERYGITLNVIFKVRKVQYLRNGTSYDQSLYEIHIVSHMWHLSLPHKI